VFPIAPRIALGGRSCTQLHFQGVSPTQGRRALLAHLSHADAGLKAVETLDHGFHLVLHAQNFVPYYP